jgi:hypothetical protein
MKPGYAIGLWPSMTQVYIYLILYSSHHSMHQFKSHCSYMYPKKILQYNTWNEVQTMCKIILISHTRTISKGRKNVLSNAYHTVPCQLNCIFIHMILSLWSVPCGKVFGLHDYFISMMAIPWWQATTTLHKLNVWSLRVLWWSNNKEKSEHSITTWRYNNYPGPNTRMNKFLNRSCSINNKLVNMPLLY